MTCHLDKDDEDVVQVYKSATSITKQTNH